MTTETLRTQAAEETIYQLKVYNSNAITSGNIHVIFNHVGIISTFTCTSI